MTKSVFLVLGMSLLMVACVHGEQKKSSTASSGYPQGYQHWRKLGGPFKRGMSFRVIYANPVALTRTGKTFPVGSVLVKEELTVTHKAGTELPGSPFRLSVMRKVGMAPGAHDGWSFEAYDPNTKKRIPKEVLDTEGCYLCHMQKADSDLVFSRIPVSPAAKIH